MRSQTRIQLGDQRGQDLAEFAIMLAIILILVAGAMKLVGAL